MLLFTKHMEMYVLSQRNPSLAGYLQRFHARVFQGILVMICSTQRWPITLHRPLLIKLIIIL